MMSESGFDVGDDRVTQDAKELQRKGKAAREALERQKGKGSG
jgi:hypothetical protein